MSRLSGSSLDRGSFARAVVTPVTAVLFVVSTVTGVMLLVHWQSALVHFSHEWLSLAFSAIAVWHVARNWGAFLRYLRQRPAVIALAVAVIGSIAVTVVTGTTDAVSPRVVFGALARAPLEVAAPALGVPAAAAVDHLAAAGLKAQPGDTLEAIGRRNGVNGAVVASHLAVAAR
jgi:hypothetical protein